MNRISETGVNNIRVALTSATSNAPVIDSLIARLLQADHDFWKSTWNACPKVGGYVNLNRFVNQKKSYGVAELAFNMATAVHNLLMIHHRLLLAEMILYSWRMQYGSFGDKYRAVPVMLVDQYPSNFVETSKQESVRIMCSVCTGLDSLIAEVQNIRQDPSSDTAYQRYLVVIHHSVGMLQWISSVLRNVYFEERLKADQIEEFVQKNFVLPAFRVTRNQAKLSQGVHGHA